MGCFSDRILPGLTLAAMCGLSMPSAPARAGGPVFAPPSGKVWVYFREKGVSPDNLAEAVADVARHADPKQAARRAKRAATPTMYSELDLPVSVEAVAAVLATGADIQVTSRWLNAVSVRATPDQVCSLRALPQVARVEPVLGGRRRDDLNLTFVPAPTFSNRGFYGFADDQMAQVNLPAVHAIAGTGQGVIIGILDTGFYRGHQVFNNPGHPLQVIAEHDFINHDGNAGIQAGDHPDQHVHGTLILSVIASYLPGTMVGGCFDASFVLCKTEDITSETPIEEDNYVGGLEFIESHGGDVATSSLGYIDWYTQANLDGATAVTTKAVNIATSLGVICCTAAGNEGHDGDPGTSHLIAPADALQVITCGAADSGGTIAGFSSDGPTADGRVKPEILARGVDTFCVWPYDDVNYATASGTSLSTPIIAGVMGSLATIRCWSVDAFRTNLFNAASDSGGVGNFDPLYIRGHGMANAFGAISAVCLADFNGDGFVTGDDFDAYVAAFEEGSSLCADVNGDGFVTGDDFDIFVAHFESGC